MNAVVCKSGVELLMEYLEGTLTLDVRAAIETHVAGCQRCEALVASYRAVPHIVREATRREMPADLQGSLRTALRAARDAEGEDDA